MQQEELVSSKKFLGGFISLLVIVQALYFIYSVHEMKKSSSENYEDVIT